MEEYEPDFDPDAYGYDEPLYDPTQQVQQRMLLILGVVFLLAMVALAFVWNKEWAPTNPVAAPISAESEAGQPTNDESSAVAAAVGGGISPVFTAEVKHWEPQIMAWAAEYELDPDIIATIMQIESCGDPQAESIAGAQGLFQVMPFHFTGNENMQDPNTNAMRGMIFYKEMLRYTDGDILLSFAGYNGGYAAAGNPWSTWPNETQRYYTWAKGIYEEAKAGNTTSDTLNQWLAAGGAGGCQRAATRLGIN